MKPKRMNRWTIGGFIALLLALGVGYTTADAQNRVVRRPPRIVYYRPYNPFWRSYYYDPFWGPYGSTYRVDPIASQREEGYSDGRSKGKKDAKKGLEQAHDRHDDYNKSKSLAYREAFVKGYADGYQRELND